VATPGWTGATGAWATVNPCAPAVPRQSSRHHFILLCSIGFRVSQKYLLHTNRGQHFGAHGTRKQDFESKFSKKKFLRMTPPYGRTLFMGEATSAHTHPSTAFSRARGASTPVLGLGHRAPQKLCNPSKNKLLAPPLKRNDKNR